MSDESQKPLFEAGEWWEEHWKGMPEFVSKDCKPFKTLYVHFESREDMEAFAKIIKQQITLDTQSVWHPEATINDFSKIRYVHDPSTDKLDDPT